MQTSYDKAYAVYGGFFSRLAAFLIDNIVVSSLLFFIKFVVWIAKLSIGSDAIIFQPVLFQYDFFAILYYLITSGYFVVATYCCGTTIGKSLMKLRVVDVNGEKLTFISVVIRETVGRYLSALIVYVGYFMIGFDSHKQALHDKISDTYVIYTHRFPVNKPVQRVVTPAVRPVQAPVPNPAPRPAPVPNSVPISGQFQAPNPAPVPKPAQVSNPTPVPGSVKVSNAVPAPDPTPVPNPETTINSETPPVQNPTPAPNQTPEAVPNPAPEQASNTEPEKKKIDYHEEMWNYF